MGKRERSAIKAALPYIVAVVAGGWLGKDTVLALQSFLNTIIGAY